MKRYTKIIDGKIVIKPKNEIIIRKNGSVTYNPSEAKILDDGWVEYIAPEPTAEDKFISAKNIKLHNIRQYDASDAVNVFYINELPIWLDKATRAGLKLRFEAEIAMGKTETTLWYGNNKFSLNLEQAVQMLYAIEVYASACYDNTQLHLANVDALQTIEDISVYDYTVGYPVKLQF